MSTVLWDWARPARFRQFVPCREMTRVSQPRPSERIAQATQAIRLCRSPLDPLDQDHEDPLSARLVEPPRLR
jgi:hypothetical protein